MQKPAKEEKTAHYKTSSTFSEDLGNRVLSMLVLTSFYLSGSLYTLKIIGDPKAI